MVQAVADTHIIIWYMAGDAKLPKSSRLFLDTVLTNGHSVGMAVASWLEFYQLQERKRIQANFTQLLNPHCDAPGRLLETIPLIRPIAELAGSFPRRIVSDSIDCFIAATALHLNLPLLTVDRKIRSLPNLKVLG
jgi:PIN domain nuclease of toxin-antitoxin system